MAGWQHQGGGVQLIHTGREVEERDPVLIEDDGKTSPKVPSPSVLEKGLRYKQLRPSALSLWLLHPDRLETD